MLKPADPQRATELPYRKLQQEAVRSTHWLVSQEEGSCQATVLHHKHHTAPFEGKGETMAKKSMGCSQVLIQPCAAKPHT